MQTLQLPTRQNVICPQHASALRLWVTSPCSSLCSSHCGLSFHEEPLRHEENTPIITPPSLVCSYTLLLLDFSQAFSKQDLNPLQRPPSMLPSHHCLHQLRLHPQSMILIQVFSPASYSHHFPPGHSYHHTSLLLLFLPSKKK